jgi:hypothetical protein
MIFSLRKDYRQGQFAVILMPVFHKIDFAGSAFAEQSFDYVTARNRPGHQTFSAKSS